jgi:hypothetical protein
VEGVALVAVEVVEVALEVIAHSHHNLWQLVLHIP